MATFNPNEPQNGEKVDADPLRDQFNALNDHSVALDNRSLNQAQSLASAEQALASQAGLIASLQAQNTAQDAIIAGLTAQCADLQAQINALKPESHEAVGFGEAGACGKLTFIGMFAGKPMYQAAGGWYYCWNESGGMWICRDALPGTGDLSNNRYADSGYAADIKDAVWGPGFNPGMMPYGMVS